jgi:hypothetical protein
MAISPDSNNAQRSLDLMGQSGGVRADPDLWALGVLPLLAAGALAGLLGVYWDIAWHIDKGRDTFFTPPHDFVYASLAIVLLTSLYGLWRDRRESPAHLYLGPLRLHSGIMIVAVAAALVLAFAPLDDLWHRLFGIDVTLWGPMHLIGILGLTLASFGGLVSSWIERGIARSAGRATLFGAVALFFGAAVLGWTVLVLAEYEFNVPQFPTIFHPILLGGLPSFILVLISRLRAHPWGATLLTAAFTIFRVAIASWLMIAAYVDLAGLTRPLIPLLIPSGVAADLLARRHAPGWLAGLTAGAVALAANLAVVRVADGIIWTPATFGAALVPALFLAATAGWAGAAVAGVLQPERVSPQEETGPRSCISS